MLHDVLRQLGQIGEIEIPLAHQILALLHAVGDEARRSGDGEQHEAEQSRRGIDVDVDAAGQLLPDGVRQQRQNRHRGEEQRAARRQQKREAADRHQQQQAEPARDAAARMQQQHQHDDVERRLQYRLQVGAAQTPPHENHAGKAEAEIKAGGGKE